MTKTDKKTCEKAKVVILCGGKGTRLHEETEYRPKPMVEIGNRPILWHIMKYYSHFGFNDFVLCLGYKAETIKEYFYNYHILKSDFTIELGCREIKVHTPCVEENWKVTLVDTGVETLKGARIKKVEKYIDSDHFLLTYGDGVADVDIDKLVEFHKSHGKIGTVTGVRPPSRFGEIEVRNSHVTNFREKPQTSTGLINGGFFVLNRKIMDYLNETEDCDFEKGALEEIAEKGELMVYEHKGNWECMDTMRDTEYLNKLWEKDMAFWKLWK
jgi:glucose-1-phosphate cytidylyltransferase